MTQQKWTPAGIFGAWTGRGVLFGPPEMLSMSLSQALQTLTPREINLLEAIVQSEMAINAPDPNHHIQKLFDILDMQSWKDYLGGD